ncbi:DUF3119 family protein [Oxynema aestuarii]|uniref:DUF3119 family protein n=1 Tax=Oxynema aestuarii TaxID=2874213 RepID=UPI001B3168A6|nr:DUF3119 family protein [Oxynema aestuarii]
MTTSSGLQPTQTVRLEPSYVLPLAILIGSIPVALLNLWIGFVILAFSIFLLLQAATLRLEFTATDLDIYRGEKRIRRFPYREWENWRIFWPPVPILLYFKEINSIHFVPVLFDPKTLQNCLEQRCPYR